MRAQRVQEATVFGGFRQLDIFEDCGAAAGIGLGVATQDFEAGRKITCTLLVIVGGLR